MAPHATNFVESGAKHHKTKTKPQPSMILAIINRNLSKSNPE
jgi:hypothetical protein